jgi:dipeptide/tripeptide permease
MSTETVPRRREVSALPWELPLGAQLAIALELCERFGFYSLLSLLALFLSAERSAGGFGWDRTPALTLLGVYSGLMYALPVVGGWVAHSCCDLHRGGSSLDHAEFIYPSKRCARRL